MTPTDHAVAAMLDTFRRAPIERDYSDKDLRAALGSSPPLEKMKMGHMPEHSPLPWSKVDDEDYFIVDKNGRVVGRLDNVSDDDFAVRAVNCHDELVAALESAREFLDRPNVFDFSCGMDHDIPTAAHWNILSEKIYVVLAKASHGAGT